MAELPWRRWKDVRPCAGSSRIAFKYHEPYWDVPEIRTAYSYELPKYFESDEYKAIVWIYESELMATIPVALR